MKGPMKTFDQCQASSGTPKILPLMQAYTQIYSRKFAYIPPETPHVIASSLSQAQLAPKLIKASQSNSSVRPDMNLQAQTMQPRTNAPPNTSMGQQATRSGIMGPPALPQSRLGTPATSSSSNRRFRPLQSVAEADHQPSTSHGPQRFFLGNSGNNRDSWQSGSMGNPGTSKDHSRRGHG